MQCKDIEDLPILRALEKVPLDHGRRRFSTHRDTDVMPSIFSAFPREANDRLRLAKLRGMISRGLITGCACGCRGDFVITEKGLEMTWRSK